LSWAAIISALNVRLLYCFLARLRDGLGKILHSLSDSII